MTIRRGNTRGRIRRGRSAEGEAARAAGARRAAVVRVQNFEDRVQEARALIQTTLEQGGDVALLPLDTRIDATNAFGVTIRHLIREQLRREDEAAANNLNNVDVNINIGLPAPFDGNAPFYSNMDPNLLAGETFRQLPTMNTVYFVSNLGRVCSNTKGIMAQTLALRYNVPTIALGEGTRRIWSNTAYLVMDTFCEMAEEHVNGRDFIIHQDGNTLNCSFGNMRRASYEEYHVFIEETWPAAEGQRLRIHRTRVPNFEFNPRLRPNDPNQSRIYCVREDGRVFHNDIVRADRIQNMIPRQGDEMEYRIAQGVRKVKFVSRGVERMIPVGELVNDTFNDYDNQSPFITHLNNDMHNDTLINLRQDTRQEYVQHIIDEDLRMRAADVTEQFRVIGQFGDDVYSNYVISNRARIFSFHINDFLRLEHFPDSYVVVCLTPDDPLSPKKYLLLHRLVCSAFNGPIPPGYSVDHIDGNKNNNNSENLEAVTPQENVRRALELRRGFELGPRSDDVQCLCMQNENEEWRDIGIFRGVDLNNYQVSNHGRVRNGTTHTLLFNGLARGYVHVRPGVGDDRVSVTVHRLVASTFLDPPRNPQAIFVDHINRTRHDNHVQNLRWVTPAENARFGRNMPQICVTNINTGQEYFFPTWGDASRFPFPGRAGENGGTISDRALINTLQGRSGPVRGLYVVSYANPADDPVELLEM